MGALSADERTRGGQGAGERRDAAEEVLREVRVDRIERARDDRERRERVRKKTDVARAVVAEAVAGEAGGSGVECERERESAEQPGATADAAVDVEADARDIERREDERDERAPCPEVPDGRAEQP
jgi:hypothetical protein